jgi:hypothetical protein
MNRELTQDECRDQRTLLKILERNKTGEWLGGGEYWLTVIKQIDAMQTSGTTDGEELAELTDEDAKERPWVMMRDDSSFPWQGPARLLAVISKVSPYIVDHNRYMRWKQCRRATENELKQAGITQ